MISEKVCVTQRLAVDLLNSSGNTVLSDFCFQVETRALFRQETLAEELHVESLVLFSRRKIREQVTLTVFCTIGGVYITIMLMKILKNTEHESIYI